MPKAGPRPGLTGNIGAGSRFVLEEFAEEVAMSKFQQKAEAQTKQIIGRMLGDGSLVEEGKEEYRHAAEGGSPAGNRDLDTIRDERGQEKPRDE
jgi:hypothetical protein